MRRAHLLRFIGGGLGGPLRVLPHSGARAKPALEAEHPSVGGGVPCHLPSVIAGQVGMFHVRAPASPAQRLLGGRLRKGGEAPLRGSDKGPSASFHRRGPWRPPPSPPPLR